MPITMTRQQLQSKLDKGEAKIKLPTPHLVAPAPPPPDTSLADAIAKIAAALATSQAEQRGTIMQALAISEQQIASIASALKTSEVEYQNWNVNITRRDALGRIAEVQFRPTIGVC